MKREYDNTFEKKVVALAMKILLIQIFSKNFKKCSVTIDVKQKQ